MPLYCLFTNDNDLGKRTTEIGISSEEEKIVWVYQSESNTPIGRGIKGLIPFQVE